jgi:hypothetical protein
MRRICSAEAASVSYLRRTAERLGSIIFPVASLRQPTRALSMLGAVSLSESALDNQNVLYLALQIRTG